MLQRVITINLIRKKDESDEEEDDEESVRKAREWDEFKDDNPIESGNRMNMG